MAQLAQRSLQQGQVQRRLGRRSTACCAKKKEKSSKKKQDAPPDDAGRWEQSTNDSALASADIAQSGYSIATPQDAIDDAERRMGKAIDATGTDLAAIRTGRASPAILDRVRVEYYGETLPLPQIASVSARDAKTLGVKPFDPGALKAIEKAISQADLGLGQPNNDGESLIINIPELTAERRKQLKKQASTVSEEGKVAVRNVRRQALKSLDGFEEDGSLSEDDRERYGREVQRLTDEHVSKLDEALSAKESELDQT